MLRELFLWGGGWPLALMSIGVGFVWAMACQYIGAAVALRPLTKESPANWMEKARLAYPVWITLALGSIFLAVLWQIFSLDRNLLSPVASAFFAPFSTLGAFLGAGVISSRVESTLRARGITLWDWLGQWGVVLILLLPNFPVFLIMACLLPDTLSVQAIVIMIAAAVAAGLMLSGGGFLLARALRLIQPATERLQKIVTQASARVGITPKGAYILRWKPANALAFPTLQRVAVTQTAMDEFTEDELVAICAHELGHLTESRWVTAARLAGSYAWLPLFAALPLSRSIGLIGVLAAVAAVLLISRLVRRLARAMEIRADAVGRTHEGESGTYARALEKLYEVNLMPAVMRQKRLPHPHLYDRLVAANMPPVFPRPGPPSRWRPVGALWTAVLAGAALIFIWRVMLTLVIGAPQ